jgi:hypothetical protein
MLTKYKLFNKVFFQIFFLLASPYEVTKKLKSRFFLIILLVDGRIRNGSVIIEHRYLYEQNFKFSVRYVAVLRADADP